MPGAERRTAVAVLHRMPWAGRSVEANAEPRCGWSGETFPESRRRADVRSNGPRAPHSLLGARCAL